MERIGIVLGLLLALAVAASPAPAQISTEVPLVILEKVEAPDHFEGLPNPDAIRLTAQNVSDKTIVAWVLSVLSATHEGYGGISSSVVDHYPLFPPGESPLPQAIGKAIRPGEQRAFFLPGGSRKPEEPYAAFSVQFSAIAFDDGSFAGSLDAIEEIVQGRIQRARRGHRLVVEIDRLLDSASGPQTFTEALGTLAESEDGSAFRQAILWTASEISESDVLPHEGLTALRELFASRVELAKAHIPGELWPGDLP